MIECRASAGEGMSISEGPNVVISRVLVMKSIETAEFEHHPTRFNAIELWDLVEILVQPRHSLLPTVSLTLGGYGSVNRCLDAGQERKSTSVPASRT